MIPMKTARLVIYCGLFISVLFFSSFDSAISATAALYLIFNRAKYAPILELALFLLLLDLLFQYLDISFIYLANLSLDAYILFLTAVFLYFKFSNKDEKLSQGIDAIGRLVVSKNLLSILVISIFSALLFLPIVGSYLAVIIGYITFSYFTKKSEGRYAYIIALVFLAFSPIFIIAKRDNLAESFAVISFYFLATGTTQEIIRIAFSPKTKADSKEAKAKPAKKHTLQVPVSAFSEKEPFSFWPFQLSPKILRPVLTVSILIASGFLIYFLIPSYSRFSEIFRLSNINKQKLRTDIAQEAEISGSVPAPEVSPSDIPDDTFSPSSQISTVAAELNIKILNGTKIVGLAASTSAKLKEAGFKNVDIGNADKDDYGAWEMVFKHPDEQIIAILTQVLDLKKFNVKEASSGAEFDLEITIGDTK